MKIIKATLMILLLIISGCEKKDNDGLYQLPNQSYSQMMSYIIEDNGKTIVIDGGTEKDMNYLINNIKKVSDDNVVDAWFLTHYHKDHTGALAKYLSSNKDDIKINSIYYNFPKDAWVKKYEKNRYQDYLTINNSLELFKNKHITYRKNEYIFGDIIIKNLRTFNPSITSNSGNNSSTVFKCMINNTSMLFLGDLGVEGGNELIELSSKEIKNTDYVQIAHHGQAGVNQDVYKIINPKYCLWPTTDWLWENKEKIYKTDETKQWIGELNVRKNYVAKDGLIHIKIK